MPKLSDSPRLTKRSVDGFKAGERERFHWDPDLRGFGLRVFPTGRKTYVIQYKVGDRTRRLTLGQHGALAPDEARKLAQQRLSEVAQGSDPSAERRQARKAPTVEELKDRYLEQHARPKKKPSSVESDERLLRLHILPALGARKVAELTRADVQEFHHSMRRKPYQANRALALLSKMLNLAERWGLRLDGSNPCRHVERYPEKKRERFLSAAELQRLGAALRDAEQGGAEHSSAIIAIRLLALTGLRTGEVLNLRWEHVEIEGRRFHLADTKTGERTVPFGAPVLELLASTPRLEGNPFVCPGEKAGQHFVGLRRPWYRIREKAELGATRLHDLRHSFASVGAGGGLGLPIIGALLGHTQQATTQRYAHLADDPLRQAAEQVSGEIAAAMMNPADDDDGGEVVEFRR